MKTKYKKENFEKNQNNKKSFSKFKWDFKKKKYENIYKNEKKNQKEIKTKLRKTKILNKIKK